jgi:hypothetical protein
MSDFKFYFEFGWKHILNIGALDHILFIIALSSIYLLKDWKQVLILITAFTIGHSITLALSVYNIAQFPSNWVEFLIPCTIILTAISNLFQKKFTPKSIRINYFLALFFGLIHGMAFASSIRFMLAKDQSLGWSLLGFNLGLELIQIAVVILILIIAQAIVSLFNFNRRKWVIFLSVSTLGIALKLALERLNNL